MPTESKTAAFAAIVRADASTDAGLPSVADVRIEAGLEALSENTRRAYGVALRAWGLWAAVHGIEALAPSPAAFRSYLLERSAAGAGLPSLRLAVAALRKLQALAGVELTAGDQIVVDTIRGLVNQGAAVVPRQAAALTANVLAAIEATACRPRVGRSGYEESREVARKRGLVDVALCRVMSDAGLRRSEAAALVWDDLQIWEDGTGRLTVRRSKTDAGARTVYLTPAAVRALIMIRLVDFKGSALDLQPLAVHDCQAHKGGGGRRCAGVRLLRSQRPGGDGKAHGEGGGAHA